MMQIFEQNDFRGMALRGKGQEDPYTSRMEINCESEEGSLNRLKGREPYLTTQLHSPAVYFEDNNVFMACYDGLGAPVDLPYSTTTFETAVCFKWDDANIEGEDLEVEGKTKFIYGHFNTANEAGAAPYVKGSPFFINAVNAGAANVWNVRVSIATASNYEAGSAITLVSTLTLSSGAWYWLRVRCPTLSATTVDTFMNGSLTTAESLTTTHTLRSAVGPTVGFCQPMIAGAIAESHHHFSNSSIAYVAAGPVNSTPDPWVSKIARLQSGDPDISFAIQDPTDSAFIARIGTAASSSYSWNFVPQQQLTVSSCSKATHILNAVGVSITDKDQYIINISNDTLFRQRTVFMFLLDIVGLSSDIIRSEDNTFKIKALHDQDIPNTSYSFVSVINPASATATCASSDYSRNMITWGSISSNGSLSNRWIAVEYIPDTSASIANVEMYYYSAATWNTMIVAAHARSQGIIPPESTRYIIGPSRFGNTKIYDFRVVVGDESWKKNHTPTLTMQDGLVTWLNCNTSSGLVGERNIKYFETKSSNGLAERKIAASDRVDGKFRYRLDPGSYKQKMTGCPYLTNAFAASVDDLIDNENGDIKGVTNSYYFETKNGVQTSYPISVSRSKNRNKVFGVGANTFVSNGSELNVVGPRTKNTSTPVPIIVCVPGDGTLSEETSCLANRGFLAATTINKVKVTTYNPDTGDESNAYGPFSFLTRATVCAYIFETNIGSQVDLRGLEVRYYRYLSGDGVYHLEGSSKINRYWKCDYGDWLFDFNYYYRSTFTFAISDVDLVLQPSLEDNDYHTPDSTHTTIYNNRGWYVDKYNPSRIYYSKQYYVGTVPTTNLLWTDEGITGDILGTLPGFGGLLLLKERSIWAVAPFASDEDVVAGQIIPNIGCVSGDAAVFVDGVLYWAATEGLFVYDGTTVTNITKDINGLQKMVWDHDPRGTRAMYDGDNFKVVFWNDGSCISLDVRNGAIRLGSSNDRCIASVSSINYSGPVYGGVGGVFKEATGNAGLLGLLDDNHSPSLMPEINCEFGDFDTGEVVNINTATAALVYNADNWYSINGDRASTFDYGSATPGSLTIVLKNAAAHTWSSAAAAAPAIARHLNGDFLGMCCRADLSTVAASQSLIAFSSSDPTKYVKLQCFENSSTSYNIRIEANDAVSTQAINIATIAVTAAPVIILRLYRVGTTFNAGYRYYNGSWGNSMDGSTSITASIGNNVYVGICAEDAVGGRVASNINRWVYGSNPLAYAALLSNRHPYDDFNGAVYGPVDVAATDYTAAVNWYWTDGNLGTGTKRVGSKFPLWTRTPTWLVHNSLVGREITHWNDARSDIWSTIIHAVENSGFGVYYYVTKQTDLDEFFIGKRPYYYRGQNVYYGKRADAKKFERIEIITGEDPGGGSADVRFGSQLHGETSEMTASGSMTFTTSVNNSLPLRLRGNYGYIEIEGCSPLKVSDVKLMRVTYKPTRPRGRLA
jgi:hypothetical protein